MKVGLAIRAFASVVFVAASMADAQSVMPCEGEGCGVEGGGGEGAAGTICGTVRTNGPTLVSIGSTQICYTWALIDVTTCVSQAGKVVSRSETVVGYHPVWCVPL
jgi:hypothetical protein